MTGASISMMSQNKACRRRISVRQHNGHGVQAVAQIVRDYANGNQQSQFCAGLEASSDGDAIEQAVHTQPTCG